MDEHTSDTGRAYGMPQIGDLFGGRYLVKRVVGQGGMGVVYSVQDMKLAGRRLALKVAKTSAGTAAYSPEAATLMRLEHPNLPQITDYYSPVEQVGVEALVMEYIDGYSLAEWQSAAQGPMPFPEVLRIGLQLCSALRYLHEQPRPIIHRDLKPSNVMIDAKGTVKLIDFGISRHYKEGKQEDTVQLGTAGYAAPERLYGGQSDARSDIYGLGAVLFSLAAGEAARVRQAGKGEGGWHIGSLPKGFPKPLADLLERMVDPDPRHRIQSMREVEQALASWQEGEGDEAALRLHRKAPVMGRPQRRIAVLALSGGAGATFLAITMAVLFARRGLAVTAAEYVGLFSEWSELLPNAFKEKSQAYWDDRNGWTERSWLGRKTRESIPVKWIPAFMDTDLDPNVRLERIERELEGCRNEVQIVDLSGEWDTIEATHLIRRSEHVVVVADPNVYKWHPVRMEKLNRLQGEAIAPNQQWHWIANKYAKFGDNRMWLSMLPGHPAAIVPLLPQEKIWGVIWSGHWPTDYAQLDQKLARALQPFMDAVDDRRGARRL